MTDIGVPLAAAILAVVFGTSFLSGLVGMAGGLILMVVLLAVGLPVPTTMTVHGVAQASSNIWRSVLWWRFVDLRILGWYAVGGASAFAIFARIDFVPDRAVVLVVLGTIPFVSMGLPAWLVPQADRPAGAILAGASSIGTQIVAGVSGPLLDSFFVRSGADRRKIVATKGSCQFLGNVAKIAYFSGIHDLGGSVSTWFVAAVAAVAFAGTLWSRRHLDSMSDASFRKWTRLILSTVGAGSILAGTYEMFVSTD